MPKNSYDFRDGDFLLIKIIEKRRGKPATPSGETYSDQDFYLFGGPKPVYQKYDIGEVAPVKIFKHKHRLAAKYRDFSKTHEEIFEDYMRIQQKRSESYSPEVNLSDTSNTSDYSDILKENQEESEKSEITTRDEWSESKSDKMSDLL